MWKSVRYLDCRSSLEAYLWNGNMISDDNLGLNLYVVSTICHVVVTLDNEVLEDYLNSLSQRSEMMIFSWVLVNF